MKKSNLAILALFMFSILTISFITGLVAAQAANQTANETAEQIKTGITNIGTILTSILTPFFGEQELLTRVFFAILLFMIVYSSVSLLFPTNPTVSTVSSIAITVLALLATPAGILEAIRTQYGALGASLLTAIPIIVLLVFTFRIKSLLVARLLWFSFFAYYIILMLYGIFLEDSSNRGWYLIGTVITLAGFYFAGFLRKAFFKGEIKAYEEEGEKIVESSKTLHKLQREELKKGYGGK